MTNPIKTVAETAAESLGGELPRPRVLLVTGLSGAGHSSALKALEDIGYEAVDNLPMSLLGSLVWSGSPLGRSAAIGVDVRTRDFGVKPLLREFDRLIQEIGDGARLVFLDCDDDVLQRRFTETRRRHVLAIDRPVSDGIRAERQLLEPLRARADIVVDTTHFNLGELRRVLHGHFGLEIGLGLTVSVTSFSYRHGLPREADLVFDVRFLTNPYYQPTLRPLSGRDPAIVDFVSADPGFSPFFDNLTELLMPLLPRYESEGKSYLTIAIGCTGGRHRSVFVAERLAAWLRAENQQVNLHHRDADRPAAAP